MIMRFLFLVLLQKMCLIIFFINCKKSKLFQEVQTSYFISRYDNDGGPSQGNLNSQSPLNPSQEESRGRLQNTLAKVLETWPDRRDHGQTVVSTTGVHHPGHGSCKPPGFVNLIH